MKTSKVTKIQKTWTDKKTGEKKTMEIEYSKVADRVKEFRQDCPRGDMVNSLEIKGEYIFANSTIIKDRADEYSPKANGTAVAKLTGYDKEFEKLQTLAVGRALAFLGYGASGEIASSEEMEEFMDYKETQRINAQAIAAEKLQNATDPSTLKNIWTTVLTPEQRKDQKLIELKDSLKSKYENIQDGAKDRGVVLSTKGGDNGVGSKKDSGVKAS